VAELILGRICLDIARDRRGTELTSKESAPSPIKKHIWVQTLKDTAASGRHLPIPGAKDQEVPGTYCSRWAAWGGPLYGGEAEVLGPGQRGGKALALESPMLTAGDWPVWPGAMWHVDGRLRQTS
jgi:hypothetical protein